MKVYLLEHLMVYPEYEDTKFIGVFSTRQSAVDAINKLIQQSGFKNAPSVIDPLLNDEASGFIIADWTVDSRSWAEGFGE